MDDRHELFGQFGNGVVIMAACPQAAIPLQSSNRALDEASYMQWVSAQLDRQNVSRETSPVRRRGCGKDPSRASSKRSPKRAGATARTGRCFPPVTCDHAEMAIPLSDNTQFRGLARNVSRETSPVRRSGCGNDPRQASSQPSTCPNGAAGRTGRCFPAISCEHAQLVNPLPGNSQFR